MATPTLINLPPPPSDPVTPSDMGPGTPNSTTTSLSALSTTAIKDGHKGHPPHQHHRSDSGTSNSSTNTLDAERADRISRLAGLERVSTVRQPNSSNPNNPSSLAPGAQVGAASTQAPAHPPTHGYFDHTGNPVLGKERSTVGSASATGSAGGRTTWASGSDVDKMSEDDGISSVGGFSDEGNASLVGFGEAANSVRGTGTPGPQGQSPMQGVVGTGGRNIDGVAGAVDAQGDRVMQSPDEERGLGKFYFEGKEKGEGE